LQNYTAISKFSKTNLPPLWPMAVGANRHGPRGCRCYSVVGAECSPDTN
jgi:hypothetical protein